MDTSTGLSLQREDVFVVLKWSPQPLRLEALHVGRPVCRPSSLLRHEGQVLVGDGALDPAAQLTGWVITRPNLANIVLIMEAVIDRFITVDVLVRHIKGEINFRN